VRRGRRKYNNVPRAGFDSGLEYGVGLELQADPSVEYIERQVKYVLIPSQRGICGKVVERPCTYKADFRVTYKDGRVEVIDAKGFRTQEYIIKRKLMLFVHGIRVIER